ncbi:MAG: aminoglycoside phosphotransferase family protein [Oscillospiraceae bacterium]|nr:aminoglycoside phosphotransferase family protein [Oscillospiraceae bacterium]
MANIFPEKWRETCDPFSLDYKNFKPLEILGYPHAGNDVFRMSGLFEGREITAFVKAARQKGADIENEVAVLANLDFPCVPKVIDFGFGEKSFSVTEELPGERLSMIVGENAGLASLSYMEEYGETLAKLHSLEINADTVAERRFFSVPSFELLEKLGLSYLGDFFSDAPKNPAKCFCHGDFHYANILWKDHRISGILDFELSGIGNRDFDIAWAIILRPGQKFLKTEEERRAFLSGYSKYGEYDPAAVRFYMAQIYPYFLEFSQNDEEYCDYVKGWLAGLK